MKQSLEARKFSTAYLTRLYIGALTAIALLAIAGQLMIQLALIQQAGDALVINVAGRQRMLSQKLSKDALAISISTDTATRNGYVQELRDTISLWQRSQTGLQHGDATLGLPGNNSETVTQLFTVIQPNFDVMIDATNHLLTTVDQDQNRPPTALDADISPYVQTILAQERQFLPGMDAIVSQYQHEAEQRVTQLKIIELTLLGITIVVLVLEATLIFRPAINRLNKSIAERDKAEAQAVAYMQELESKNTELELAFDEAMVAHRKVMPHARVVALGHYQVQGSRDRYYSVNTRNVNGNLLLECECPMYRRNLICSHSLAAASLHSALMRNQQQPIPKSPSMRRLDGTGIEW